jgi:hypothetical protein
MSLEPSLIAGEPVGFASQDQISPALGVRSTSFNGNEFAHCPRIWVRSCRLKAVATEPRPVQSSELPDAHDQRSVCPVADPGGSVSHHARASGVPRVPESAITR